MMGSDYPVRRSPKPARHNEGRPEREVKRANVIRRNGYTSDSSECIDATAAIRYARNDAPCAWHGASVQCPLSSVAWDDVTR